MSSRFHRYIELAEINRAEGKCVWDVTSYEGKQFRNRFRVPYEMFDDILREYNEVDTRCPQDLWGRKKSELSLLILGALRVLGHYTPFDGIEELNDISLDKNNKFFKEFVQWFAKTKYKEAVKFPETAEEINHVLCQYEKVGFPGCLGSIDCVHVPWDCCPAGHRTDCTGKEGYPTLAFQVVSTPTRRILASTREFYGTWNDKLISRHDETVKRMRTAHRYTKHNWAFIGSDGEEHTETGLYFICDGGYQSWPVFICPFKDQREGTLPFKWSKHAESIRKDVECTFGILKKRFMILKHPSRFRDQETIGHVFKTCCALHNMLIEFDGYDSSEDIAEVEDLGRGRPRLNGTREITAFSRGERMDFHSRVRASEARVGERLTDPIPMEAAEYVEERERFEAIRNNLIVHYTAMSRQGRQA